MNRNLSIVKHLIGCLCLAFFAFVLKADAQACGAYYINVSVRDEGGKPVSNAKVDLKGIEKDESAGKNFVRDAKDLSLFSLQLSEGQIATVFHKIVVSAPGYNTSDLLTKFLSCTNRGVTVKLSKTGSSKPAVWDLKNTVELQVESKSGEDIPSGMKLTVIDSHGVAQDVPTQRWFAFFDLPNGEYTLCIEVPGYQTREEKLDLRPLANMYLKLQLTKKQ